MSETATARELLAPFCVGNGLDIGAGGDPIVPSAICLDREPGDNRRAQEGSHPTHLIGDAGKLHWFNDGVLDWVYSSHALEDFEDTKETLTEWSRVIRTGGNLVLFLPDQPTYAACCLEAGTTPNQAHKHATFGLQWVLDRLPLSLEVLESRWPFPGNRYSFSLVARKLCVSCLARANQRLYCRQA